MPVDEAYCDENNLFILHVIGKSTWLVYQTLVFSPNIRTGRNLGFHQTPKYMKCLQKKGGKATTNI